MIEASFVGIALPRETSDLVPAVGPPVQRDFVDALATAHERAGFDAVLVGESSTSPDALTLAQRVLAVTPRLGVVTTVRPGVVAPTYAARSLATLDALHPGRVAVHLPDVVSDTEPRRDGDWLDRSGRQRRRAEFGDLLLRTWSGGPPIEHLGEFHRLSGGWSAVRPPQPLPLWISGRSTASDTLAARIGGVYVLPAEPLGDLRARIARVRTAAGDRPIRFAIRLRPIVRGDRDVAHAAAEEAVRVQRGHPLPASTLVARATGALPKLGALIGIPSDVAAVLMRYRELGIDVFHLCGHRPLADAQRFAEVIKLVREGQAAAA